MEALTVEMQAKIRKRSSERLRMYLIKAGRDEDDVMTWDRDKLMEEWALEIGKEEEEFKASPASPVETDYELQKRRLEFEIRKYEEQKEKRKNRRRRKKEKGRNGRRRRKEKGRNRRRRKKEKGRNGRRRGKEKGRNRRRRKKKRKRKESKKGKNRRRRKRGRRRNGNKNKLLEIL